MTFSDTFALVVSALDDSGIPHMITGSFASAYYSEPRATQDVDMVIDPATADALDQFVALLESNRFYLGGHRDAFARRATINVVDLTNGWKVDLVMRHDRPFSQTEFARRQPASIEGIDVHLATAEDVVLSKLEWATLGESERQKRDVLGVLRAVGPSLDRTYLATWAETLGVDDALRELLELADLE